MFIMSPSPKKDGQNKAKLTAVKMLGTLNLHQCLWLPATDNHEKLRVTFSTTSNFDDSSLPVVLFVGPMFGTRYGSLMFDKMAKETGVRVICTDRPGFGGSSPVSLDERINVWLETVPAILDKLKVKHVSLVSHSAGTMYSLNTLHHLRDRLDPGAPFVAYIAPWVHCEHSKSYLWSTASKLPKNMISTWSNINKFINNNIMPVTSWSGGVTSSVAGLFQAGSGSNNSGETSSQEKFGVDKETADELERLNMKYLFAEGIEGVNEEALLCLKKGNQANWGVCDDYPTFVQNLASSEKERNGHEVFPVKLKVRLFFAPSDIMVGKTGNAYFDRVWHQDGVAEAISVQSKTMPDTNHDSVLLDFKKGAVREIFQEISRNSARFSVSA